ncbi:hypothetical protein GOP47_0028032 [Adiantum capillus-veneris]|nr:hypothetical protein GOP47_0028032 [Adiantum capillus-veneris]
MAFPPSSTKVPGILLHVERGGVGIVGIGGGPPSPANLESNNNITTSLGIKANTLILIPSSFMLDAPYKGPSLPQPHHGWSPLIGQQPGVYPFTSHYIVGYNRLLSLSNF